MTGDGATAALQERLDRVADHLEHLARRMQSLEDAIGDTIDWDNVPQSWSIPDLQQLDFLRQSLEDLAILLPHLGHPDLLEDVSPVMAQLRLRSTLHMLGKAVPSAAQSTTASSGDLDLF